MSITQENTYRPFGIFRFALALLVLFQHGLHLLPLDLRALFYHMELGVPAVAVFFALSGFIVAEANAVFYWKRPKPFLANRLLRILPPYVAALFLAIAINASLYYTNLFTVWDEPLTGSPLQPKILLAGLCDILPFFQPRYLSGQDFHFIPFAWTLRVEFTFYLFAFVIYWLLTTGLPQRLKSWMGYGAFCFVYILFALFLFYHEKLPQQLGDIPYFLFGVCLYRLWHTRSLFNLFHLFVSLLCLTLAFPLWIQKGSPILAFQLPLLFTLLAIFVYLTFRGPVSARWKKLDKWFGDLSYPLYLNHISVLFLVSCLGAESLGWPIYIIGIALSIPLSFLMYWLVETPLKKIRDRVRGTVL